MLVPKKQNTTSLSPILNALMLVVTPRKAPSLWIKIGDGSTMSKATPIALLAWSGIRTYVPTLKPAPETVQLTESPTQIGQILMAPMKLAVASK